jgi:hypothetical protein
MNKIISVTWSYEDDFNLKDTFLYRSFIKHNTPEQFIHIHYNRNNYKQLEAEFKEKYSFQYEFLLYKIYLTKDKLKNIDADCLIFCDANDTVCLGNINIIQPPSNVIFSTEINQYPSSMGDWGGLEYSEEERIKKQFLNAGLFVASKENYIALLESVTNNIMTKNLKSFGGDQGVFIFHYLSKHSPEIIIDKESKLFFCSFSRDYNNYINYSFPLLVHDNGWDWGSPRFIEKFKLV